MDKIALIVGYEKLEKENKRLQRDHDALLADVGRVSLIRQELERELIGVKAVVETFIRCVHADGDSDMDWGKLPTLLDAIEDYVDEGREALAIVAKLPMCWQLRGEGDERELKYDFVIIRPVKIWMLGGMVPREECTDGDIGWCPSVKLVGGGFVNGKECYNSLAAAEFAKQAEKGTG